jgi:hypothetical protein
MLARDSWWGSCAAVRDIARQGQRVVSQVIQNDEGIIGAASGGRIC